MKQLEFPFMEQMLTPAEQILRLMTEHNRKLIFDIECAFWKFMYKLVG